MALVFKIGHLSAGRDREFSRHGPGSKAKIKVFVVAVGEVAEIGVAGDIVGLMPAFSDTNCIGQFLLDCLIFFVDFFSRLRVFVLGVRYESRLALVTEL